MLMPRSSAGLRIIAKFSIMGRNVADHHIRKLLFAAFTAGPGTACRMNTADFTITRQLQSPTCQIPTEKIGMFSYHVRVHSAVNQPWDLVHVSVHPQPDFDFKRLGVRVPTIAISPWINKGPQEKHQLSLITCC
jgi:hypothetical protein